MRPPYFILHAKKQEKWYVFIDSTRNNILSCVLYFCFILYFKFCYLTTNISPWTSSFYYRPANGNLSEEILFKHIKICNNIFKNIKNINQLRDLNENYKKSKNLFMCK